MNVRPLHDRVLVKRNAEPTKSKGGLFLPESSQEKPIEGTVLAVGSGKLNDDGSVTALQLKAGDRVVFGKYAGTEIKVQGDELLIMREDDVLGVME